MIYNIGPSSAELFLRPETVEGASAEVDLAAWEVITSWYSSYKIPRMCLNP
jgi:hypothetical protein